MKIVINKCYGGFSLSDAGILKYAELKGISLYLKPPANITSRLGNLFYRVYYTTPDFQEKTHFSQYDIKRDDPFLIQTIEELGQKAASAASNLRIVEIPDGVEWMIDEYDGMEWVAQKHQIWS